MLKKKLGIIGGMGSRAGAFFLKKVIDYSPADTDQEFLEIIFHNNSLIPDRTRAIVYNEPSPVDDILRSIRIFNDNKVEVIVLACITSYFYYDQIRNHTRAWVINPLQLVSECIRNEYPGIQRVGVLATTGSLKTGLFQKELNHGNIQVVTLNPSDQEMLFMRSVYMKNGFKSAHISEEAKYLMRKSKEKIQEQNVDLIIGGCTEVSIAIDPELMDIPYIDTLDLLARKTVDYCYCIDKEKFKSGIYG